MRRIAMVLGVVYLIALAALFATSDGMRDYNGRPLGTDFSNVYAAGQMARDGDGVRAFDPHYHLARQAEIFNDPDIPVYGWHYPPFFLLVAAALALLPYTAAYLFWQAATLPLYLRAVSAIAPGRTSLVAALVLPATFVNFTHGQNGFLTAALIGAAMALLDRRPLVAGVLIGLLAYKPQFGVLIPLVLIATGRWRVIGAAAATIAGLVAASTLAFGPGVWPAFIDNMRFTNTAIVDGGGPGWEKVQSLYAALRHLGAPGDIAMAAQGALALALVASVVRLWRSRADQGVKAAGLIAASLLATPYVLDYDFVALAPAMAFLAVNGAEKGWGPYEKTLLALAFAAPLFSRQLAEAAYIPLGFIALAGVYAVALMRARRTASLRQLPKHIAAASGPA
ncbi:MAG: glycosyltransferase family 87 protein [Parvularculaceae bacterium]